MNIHKQIQNKQIIITIVMILAMLNNFEHSSYVYYTISQKIFPYQWLNWLQSFLVILGIDLFIVVYVMHSRLIEAGVFSLAFYALNLVYVGLFDKIVAELVFPFLCVYGVFTLALLYEKNKQKQYINASQENEKSIKINDLNDKIANINSTHKDNLSNVKDQLDATISDNNSTKSDLNKAHIEVSAMSDKLSVMSVKLSEVQVKLNIVEKKELLLNKTIEKLYSSKSRSKNPKPINIDKIVNQYQEAI